MRVAAAQIAPVLLDREATCQRVVSCCEEARAQGVDLLAFPEAFVPGYPSWLERTDAARFDNERQKAIHARYLDQAVELPGPQLETLRQVAKDLAMTLVVGVMERGSAAGRGSLWATALTVRPDGEWLAHRKLVPTYEERLAWSPGDGHGLVVQQVSAKGETWRVGALNCWENWMPAARMALYAQGEEVHVSIWPGSPHNTKDITQFIAREGRVYVVAACALLQGKQVPEDFPHREVLLAEVGEDGYLHRGGSRVVGPDGKVLACADDLQEGLVIADLDRALLDGERQNLDPSGHYHRSDVFRFEVDRRRQKPAEFRD